jgi:hypothetical protein|tara:strand:+ start:14 stop:475 length:462 start_codon:yes stop_codon:yes gene_type:complete
MAYWAIFTLPTDTQNTRPIFVAPTDAVKDAYFAEHNTCVQITDQQADDFFCEKKNVVINKSDNSLVWSDNEFFGIDITQDLMESWIENIQEAYSRFIKYNKIDNGYKNEIITWIQQLEALDLSSVSYPIANSSPAEVLKNSFSQTKISPLLIP